MTASPPAAASPSAPPAYAYDAFISYSSHDLDLARALRDKLVKEGIRVWFDKDRLTVGTNINAAIDEALDQSRHLIALLSPASLASDWASMERHVAMFGDADARRRTLLPIVVGHVNKLPGSLRLRQYLKVDGVADLDRILPEILSTLRATAKNPPVAAPPPRPSRAKAALVLVSRVLAVAAAVGPIAHRVHPGLFTRQWTTIAMPAILALAIGVEVTFKKYRVAIAEVVALALGLVYLAFLPPDPSGPVPVPLPTTPTTTAPSDPPVPPPPPTTTPTPGPTAPHVPRPPPKSTTAPDPSIAPTAPPVPTGVTSGDALCTASSCNLGAAPLDPSVTLVCLSTPSLARELAGVPRITCTPIPGTATCNISYPPLTRPLMTPVSWKACK